MKLKIITDDHQVVSDGKINNISKEYPCISCHTNCCKEYTIFVNAHDIYRLSTNLELEPEKFLEISEANELTPKIKKHGFELYVTRDLESAKSYVKERYDNQNEKRFGLLASSDAKILKNYGILNDFKSTKSVEIGPWYNDESTSPKSCCALNSVATEFSCQGLELDMPIVCWGEDLIWSNDWQTMKNPNAKDPHKLRLNKYRVLLTRGRDGIIIYIPNESKLDSTYEILVKSGLDVL